jgi:hypothetical protein
MKIKCIKASVDDPNKDITNGDMREYLIIGTLFFAFGIRFFKSITYVYIFDGNHLFEVPIELFEVVDNKVSNEWSIRVWENGEITLWPDLFYQDGFLENFAERELEERKLFEGLRGRIEKSQ